MLLIADKRAQVSFFTNYLFFRRDYADTYTYSHTLRFSDTLCLKNAINTFFLKLHFFSLYSFSLPPKHFLIIFSGKVATKKWSKNLPKEEKNFFPFFIIFFTFSLSPYGKKQNDLLFPPFLSLEIGKPQGKTSFTKFFFSFFFDFFPPYHSSKSEKLPLTFLFEIPT